MKNGVPYDRAISMSDEERFAHAVIFAGFEGTEFDWQRMRWKERKP
ncbi:hypothetical protein [Roseomonas chloroacetimidivorans]